MVARMLSPRPAATVCLTRSSLKRKWQTKSLTERPRCCKILGPRMEMFGCRRRLLKWSVRLCERCLLESCEVFWRSTYCWESLPFSAAYLFCTKQSALICDMMHRLRSAVHTLCITPQRNLGYIFQWAINFGLTRAQWEPPAPRLSPGLVFKRRLCKPEARWQSPGLNSEAAWTQHEAKVSNQTRTWLSIVLIDS